MGKFHPHGDASIYDAMVRLAQGFAARFPLVEGQGNFGNIDGDNPAAMRYTEARLTEVAKALLAGIDDDAVDFRPTYDGEEHEPVVLPGGFPNLLANGAAGIAVGMATSIPPHNAGEVCAAAIHLVRNPEAATADLLAHMPGPDFPTGGVLVEDRAALLAAYETGRGGFRMRAKWEVERAKHGTWAIVVTEIPYQVQKSRLIEQVAQLLEEKKLPLLADVRDESSDTIRVVFEPKSRGVEPEVLMETLFRATALETRFPLNMNVLTADRTPVVLGLKRVLRAWLDHREIVLVRRSQHRLSAIERRLEILDRLPRRLPQPRRGDPHHPLRGRAESRADGVVQPGRRAGRGDPEHAAAQPAQARGIGDPQGACRPVARTGRRAEAARQRQAALGPDRDGAGGDADQVRHGRARRPAHAARRRAGAAGDRHRRRSSSASRSPSFSSDKGWLRAVRGHLADGAELKFKEGDRLRLTVPCETTDRLCLFATRGPRHHAQGRRPAARAAAMASRCA